MSFSEDIFKAYDIRGIYNQQLNAGFAYKLGRAFVSYIKCKQVVVGRDARESSDALFEQLLKGILDQGADVIELGQCTTPMFYYAVAEKGYDGGIMITASHNPAEYNGFKLTREHGIPIGLNSGGREIKELVKQAEFADTQKGKHVKQDILQEYIEHCLSAITQIDEFKVVADFGNGMACLLVPKIFEALPCKLIPMFSEIDMSFPNHEANPAKPENLQALKQRVVAENADLGMAFDGDGDRIFFVTETGEIISGDFTTALIAEEMLKEAKGQSIVYDLRSSWAVKEMIEKSGGIAVETKVGYAFIKTLMREKQAIFAGELSGHFYYKYNHYHESSVITALKMMELMCQERKKLSELLKPLQKYSQSGEINREVADRAKALEKVESAFQGFKLSKLDGLKIETQDYWFNIRPSNTEPVVRLTAEAKTPKLLKEITEKVLKLIE